MKIRPSKIVDCLAIAELAQIAGENMPGHFWADAQQPGQSLVEAGAEIVKSTSDNFSYRNVTLACHDDEIAAMVLAYPLPTAAEAAEDLNDFPEFVRPMIELEQCVPESFYVNMLAAFPRFRGQGCGSLLMAEVDKMALAKHCKLISIQVFSSNHGALRLYQRLGFEIIERRPMVASDYHAAADVLLLTKTTPA